MTLVSEQDSLRLWESGARLAPLQRARALMAFAHPESDVAELDALPVGTRNARALRVFADNFGDIVPCELQCPECSARLEFRLAIADLLASHRDQPGELRVEFDGREFRARVPTDRDLRAALEDGSGADGVMTRCALVPPLAEWPAEVVRTIEERMVRSDPLSVIRLSMTCPDCKHTWDSPLDAVGIVYERVSERARGLLLEVHRLAQAYGWSESETLALSQARRQHYLALVGE